MAYQTAYMVREFNLNILTLYYSFIVYEQFNTIHYFYKLRFKSFKASTKVYKRVWL